MASSHNPGHTTRLLLQALLLILAPICAHAQTNRLLQEGNKLYDQHKYDAATSAYMKALQKDPNNTAGLFNLGNALYQKQQFDSSRKIMAATAIAIKDKNGKAAANYNIGNTYMAQKKWEDAVNAYKQTLRNNPQDADAKYNLSYAEQMLKKQNNGGGGKNDKKDKKDQKQDKKDQNKDDKNKDKDKQDQNKDQQNKDKQDQDKDQQQQQSPSKLSKEQADNMLNALQQQEKKLQDKMKKEKGIPVKMDKDW